MTEPRARDAGSLRLAVLLAALIAPALLFPPLPGISPVASRAALLVVVAMASFSTGAIPAHLTAISFLVAVVASGAAPVATVAKAVASPREVEVHQRHGAVQTDEAVSGNVAAAVGASRTVYDSTPGAAWTWHVKGGPRSAVYNFTTPITSMDETEDALHLRRVRLELP
jgi:hypothetical protein